MNVTGACFEPSMSGRKWTDLEGDAAQPRRAHQLLIEARLGSARSRHSLSCGLAVALSPR